MPEIIIDLEVTETYRTAVPVQTLLDELAHYDTTLTEQLRRTDAAGVAAWLHRLQLDDPQHPVVQMIWGRMESNGEVSGETWTFTPGED